MRDVSIYLSYNSVNNEAEPTVQDIEDIREFK